jgi:hypothetical protein
MTDSTIATHGKRTGAMNVLLKKLDVTGLDDLSRLVADNIDAIEPGLRVIEPRVFLGPATIDILGVDADGTPVLLAVGFTADDELLLRVIDAYSSWLEYPQSVSQHHPSILVSEDRRPRVIVVAERMPEAFHRKVKRLDVPLIDCVEFRRVEVNGAPAIYFERIVRLRRNPDSPLQPGAAIAAKVSRALHLVTAEAHDSSTDRAKPTETPGVGGRRNAALIGTAASFSMDGVVTRQWMDFLSQLSTR